MDYQKFKSGVYRICIFLTVLVYVVPFAFAYIARVVVDSGDLHLFGIFIIQNFGWIILWALFFIWSSYYFVLWIGRGFIGKE